MATITIRNIEDAVKARLRIRADAHGHSIAAEARLILKRAVRGMSGSDLWDVSRQLFAGESGVLLEPSSRDCDRAAPDFGAGNTSLR